MAARTLTHPTPFDVAARAAAAAPAAKAEGYMTGAELPRIQRSGDGDGDGDVDALVARWMR